MGKFYQAVSDELIIYVSHLAWLNAVPDGGEISRRDEFERDDFPVELPECDAEYLLGYLFELGVVIGDGAITHGEIESWMSNTGIELTAWEARTLKTLSDAYLKANQGARKVDAETVWNDAPYYMSGKWRKAMRLKASIRKAAEI